MTRRVVFLLQKGGGILGLITSVVEDLLRGKAEDLRVVSVYETQRHDKASFVAKKENATRNKPRKNLLHSIDVSRFVSEFDPSKWIGSTEGGDGIVPSHQNSDADLQFLEPPSSCVWISAKNPDQTYMDIVKLTGLLELKLAQVSFPSF